jgi:hypothetical protein
VADPLECIAFSVGDTPVTVGDVLRAEHARGALQPVEELLAWKAACLAEADRLSLGVDEDAVDELSTAFRYERDLVSAEEIEAWLEARGLTPEEFQDHFVGGQLFSALRDQVDAPEGETDPEEEPDWAALAAELHLSGTFPGHAVQHSRRLLVRAAAGATGDLDLAELESAYQAACAALLTPAALGQELAGARLPLTLIDYESSEFDSVDAAREALLCVRDDGMELAEVARESGFPHSRQEAVAEDLPEDLREPLLWAPLGALQGPTASGGVFRLWRVFARTEPRLTDPEVRRRVEARVLAAHFAGTGSSLLHWTLQ